MTAQQFAYTAVIALALTATSAVAQTVVLTPDEDVLIERYIVEAPLPPAVVIEENTTLRPGSAVPSGVPLQPFGGQSALAKYGYFVSVDNKIVVVDPATRTVVRILNAKR